jgi:hypothetical protein
VPEQVIRYKYWSSAVWKISSEGKKSLVTEFIKEIKKEVSLKKSEAFHLMKERALPIKMQQITFIT